jgi:hypothetical protein
MGDDRKVALIMWVPLFAIYLTTKYIRAMHQLKINLVSAIRNQS